MRAPSRVSTLLAPDRRRPVVAGAVLLVALMVANAIEIEPVTTRHGAVSQLAHATHRDAVAALPAVAAEVAAASQRAKAATPARPVDGHIGGQPLAAALRAADFDYGRHVALRDVAAAAERFGVSVGQPITTDDVEALRVVAWRHADHRFALAGLNPGKAPDPSDIRDGAARLGVWVHERIGPGDVERVLEAGEAQVAGDLARVGIDVGEALDLIDVAAAAERLEVPVGERIDGVDTKKVAAVARDRVQRRWEARHHTPAFATTAGVTLRLPSHRVEYAGFHQASYPVALTMHPGGKATTRILPSRRRGTGRTTAIDVVQAPGEDVRAPVTGTVAAVERYDLYGKYPDHRLRIVPDDNPRTVATVLHVEGPEVKPGDRVEGGMTVIADSARTFPFRSQIDRFSGRHWGHVHIELRRR